MFSLHLWIICSLFQSRFPFTLKHTSMNKIFSYFPFVVYSLDNLRPSSWVVYLCFCNFEIESNLKILPFLLLRGFNIQTKIRERGMAPSYFCKWEISRYFFNLKIRSSILSFNKNPKYFTCIPLNESVARVFFYEVNETRAWFRNMHVIHGGVIFF